ncbi:TIGR02444 family protein [Shewanella algae]
MPHTSLFTPNLWQECEALYPSLEKLLIELQDKHGLIVNLILLALTLDDKRVALDCESWSQLHTDIAQWESGILHPYRRLRRLAKPNLEQTEYQQMLDVELKMERRGQHLILHKLNGLPRSISEDKRHNLSTYLALFNLSPQQHPALLAPA